MAEAWSPLLPWKLVGLTLLLLALLSGWRLSWDPFFTKRQRPLESVERLPERHGEGEAVLFIANSRMGYPLEPPSVLSEVLEPAGLQGADAAVVREPNLRASELTRASRRLAAFKPTVVVVQLDVLMPLARREGRPRPDLLLLNYERDGRELLAGVELIGQLGVARGVVADVPLPETLSRTVGEAWWRDRMASYERLRAVGFQVIPAREPWPDDLFMDPLHLDPTGSARFRRWLGQGLARGAR